MKTKKLKQTLRLGRSTILTSDIIAIRWFSRPRPGVMILTRSAGTFNKNYSTIIEARAVERNLVAEWNNFLSGNIWITGRVAPIKHAFSRKIWHGRHSASKK